MRKFASTIALFSIVFLAYSISYATSNLVNDTSITISGVSYREANTTIYGGIAGTCATTTGTGTCNSCTPNTTLSACNQTSVYASLPLTVSFKSSSDVTAAKAHFYFMASTSTTENVSLDLAAQDYRANDTTATFTTTWGDICNAFALGSDCNTSLPTSATPYSGKIGFGIDSDNNGNVDTTETKTIDVKLHVVPSTDTTIATTFCTEATKSTFSGVCNLGFEPGDNKVYIQNEYLWAGHSSASGMDWDALAVFPVSANGDGTATISGFTPGQANPVFLAIDKNGGISNSEISGGLENYRKYCFIYGNRNKAQNIYKFIAGPNATPDATAIANQICISPSEVVGALDDKHCFISTAAFGSDMAKEVQVFRKFRNQFLLTNPMGHAFVKLYYTYSPPLAKIISQNEFLKTTTRTILYPFLGFSYLAINYGFMVALLTLALLLILIFNLKSLLNQKNQKYFLFFFIGTIVFPLCVRAQIQPDSKLIQHPGSAQGLVKIKKDGTYVYEAKRELKKESSSITLGYTIQPNVTIDVEKIDANTGNVVGKETFNFDDLYTDASGVIVGYTYENFRWAGKAGKLGYQLGVNLMYAQGHGIVVTTLKPSRETFTFFTIPLNLGAVYRFESKDKQIFAPFVSGGGTYVALVEKRSDKSTPNYTGAPGFYASGGCLVNLSVLDTDNGFALENEYGIGNLWLSIEYKLVAVNSDLFDFSNQYLNAGLSFDF